MAGPADRCANDRNDQHSSTGRAYISTLGAGVGSGAAALEVGLGEHRTQRMGKCHAVANGALWNVARRGFSRVEEARKPSLTPAFLPQSSTKA